MTLPTFMEKGVGDGDTKIKIPTQQQGCTNIREIPSFSDTHVRVEFEKKVFSIVLLQYVVTAGVWFTLSFDIPLRDFIVTFQFGFLLATIVGAVIIAVKPLWVKPRVGIDLVVVVLTTFCLNVVLGSDMVSNGYFPGSKDWFAPYFLIAMLLVAMVTTVCILVYLFTFRKEVGAWSMVGLSLLGVTISWGLLYVLKPEVLFAPPSERKDVLYAVGHTGMIVVPIFTFLLTFTWLYCLTGLMKDKNGRNNNSGVQRYVTSHDFILIGMYMYLATLVVSYVPIICAGVWVCKRGKRGCENQDTTDDEVV